MEKFVYKSRQEKILIDEILSSSFLFLEILLEIKKLYSEKVPYHNFLHALQMASWVLLLDKTKFNLLEIKSLLIAGLFHDAWHSWTVNILDEYNSLDLALQNIENFQKKFDLWLLDFSIIRKAIIWTVFTKRWKIDNIYWKIMWDLDIWIIWWDFLDFCYYWFIYCCELWLSEKEFLEKTEIWYFKYLVSLNKEIFFTIEVKNIYPQSFQNIKKFINTDYYIKKEMLETLKNEDITLEEFKEKFNKI